jgi:hypothetical protein
MAGHRELSLGLDQHMQRRMLCPLVLALKPGGFELEDADGPLCRRDDFAVQGGREDRHVGMAQDGIGAQIAQGPARFFTVEIGHQRLQASAEFHPFALVGGIEDPAFEAEQAQRRQPGRTAQDGSDLAGPDAARAFAQPSLARLELEAHRRPFRRAHHLASSNEGRHFTGGFAHPDK